MTVTPPDGLPMHEHGQFRPSDPRTVLRTAYRRVFAYFRRRVSASEASVLTQETFLRLSAWQDGDPGRMPAHLMGFLFANARWVRDDHFRKRARMNGTEMLTGDSIDIAALEDSRLLLASDTLPTELADVARGAALERAVAELSDRKRQALVFRYVDDLTTSQIADVFGVTPRAVNQMIKNAVSELSKSQHLAAYAPRGGHQ